MGYFFTDKKSVPKEIIELGEYDPNTIVKTVACDSIRIDNLSIYFGDGSCAYWECRKKKGVRRWYCMSSSNADGTHKPNKGEK